MVSRVVTGQGLAHLLQCDEGTLLSTFGGGRCWHVGQRPLTSKDSMQE